MTLRRLDSDLWVAESPLRFCGLEVGARMTVVRLAADRLLVHSPIAASDELVRQVRELGNVAFLVAPNRYHHLFVSAWQRAFPDAEVHVAPGVERKQPDLVVSALLDEACGVGEAREVRWANEIEQVFLAGAPFLNETVFFHRASGTLVASDLAFHIGPGSPFGTRALFRVAGTYGRLGPTLLERVIVRERAVFRSALERILDWPFERVIVAHGAVSEKRGRAQLVDGYSWIFDGDSRTT